MKIQGAVSMSFTFFFLLVLCMAKLSMASTQKETIVPGFQGSQMDYIDNNGFFLLSKSSVFAFGFITYTATDTTSYLLAVVHQPSSQTVWTANPTNPISHSDDFTFSMDGNAVLKSGDATVWSTNTSNASTMELLNSGDLVVLGSDASAPPLWRSFLHPTDTLLSGQSFTQGTTLVSQPNAQNSTYHLSIDSGDMKLYLNFKPPQPYWSMQQDERKIVNQLTGDLHSATIVNNSWTFYTNQGSVLWQFVFTQTDDVSNATWAAVLNNQGIISFVNLESSGSSSTIKVPQNPCDSPDSCNPYFICYSGSRCQCPAILSAQSNCNPSLKSPCTDSSSFSLAKIEDNVGYFATKFVSPLLKTNLTGCKNACMNNCSCVAVFYEEGSNNCYVFNQIASLQQLNGGNSNYSSFLKIASNSNTNNDNNSNKSHQLVLILVICIGAALLITVLLITGFKIHRKKKQNLHEHGSQHEQVQYSSEDEDDNFFNSISTMPVRFSFKDLESATDSFAIKLGQGGFGSVYLGTLKDGSKIAVKKLEGIGQGKKEFRAEVSIIGSIHHVHLVKLRGFCAEGPHRLLAYEYLSNGSLDRWIFHNNKNENEKQVLDWNQRYNIALGTAKGLAYLHHDCDSKIIHCDIKPENVLLDEHFVAKVSDFGLAKLMTREQSHVFTTLRGTRGYLAPEWIMNYAISEKSDVYSYGMVLLEIIGGRKSFEPNESAEKAYYPSYALQMLQENKVHELVDQQVGWSEKKEEERERIERMVKVALWCVQEEVGMRPGMGKVVGMLEGGEHVPQLPTSGGQVGWRLYKNVFVSGSEEGVETGTTSGTTECNSEALLSAVRLSGPR
ncbi:hypothetical protein LUZ60_005604 [Juncus effusus]|nr:hypothetical protein LUZ60_005604 [Juncus effusus]